MPSFTKFDSIVGSSTRSWNRPRSAGPSQRAVMMPFTMPMAIMATCPPRTWTESATKCRLALRSATRALPGAGRERVEREAAGTQHGRTRSLEERPPELRDLGLVGIAGRFQVPLVHRDVRRAQPSGGITERVHGVHVAIVDEALLEVAQQHVGPFDEVGVGDLLEHEHASGRGNGLVGLAPEDIAVRVAGEEDLGGEAAERDPDLVR